MSSSLQSKVNSSTPVSLGVTAQEVYRAFITGSAEPSGDIEGATANNFTSGAADNQNEVLFRIASEDRQTQILAGRVPVDCRRRIKHMRVSMLRTSGADGSVNAVLETRDNGSIFRKRRSIFVTTSSPYNSPIYGLVLDPLTDFRVRIRDVSDTGTYIAGSLGFEDLTVPV